MIKTLFVLLISATTHAATVNLGDIFLQPNTPSQIVEILVTGGDVAFGLNFNVQVGTIFPARAPVPVITDVDITGPNTIFGTSNNGQTLQVIQNIAIVSTTTEPNELIVADGVLAIVTFDTTGIFNGQFPLLLSGTANGPTELLDMMTANILAVTNGRLVLVVEPTARLMLFLGLIGVLGAGRTRAKL